VAGEEGFSARKVDHWARNVDQSAPRFQAVASESAIFPEPGAGAHFARLSFGFSRHAKDLNITMRKLIAATPGEANLVGEVET
jgi:hypothetical protein